MPPGPPLTSAAGQLGATRRACQEAPSQGAKLCRAGSGSLAPSKESKQGRREAVESEKLQQVRACEAGASRRDIMRRVWLPAGRPFRSPKLLLAAPRPGVSPGPPPHSRPSSGPARLVCPGRPPLSVWEEEAGAPHPSCWPGGHPACPQTPGSRETGLRDSQDTGQEGHSQCPSLALGWPAPMPRYSRVPLQGTAIPSLAAQLSSQRGRDVSPGAS